MYNSLRYEKDWLRSELVRSLTRSTISSLLPILLSDKESFEQHPWFLPEWEILSTKMKVQTQTELTIFDVKVTLPIQSTFNLIAITIIVWSLVARRCSKQQYQLTLYHFPLVELRVTGSLQPDVALSFVPCK